MSGYKVFGAETLTAEDVNNYLMAQSVIVVNTFAELAAILLRREGMHAYSRDTGITYRCGVDLEFRAVIRPDVDYTATGIATAASGWTLTAQRGIVRSGIAFVFLTLTRTGGTITVPTTGDIANTPIATLSSGWRAPALTAQVLTLTGGGVGPISAGYIGTDGLTLSISAIAPGANIVNTDSISLGGNWPIA